MFSPQTLSAIDAAVQALCGVLPHADWLHLLPTYVSLEQVGALPKLEQLDQGLRQATVIMGDQAVVQLARDASSKLPQSPTYGGVVAASWLEVAQLELLYRFDRLLFDGAGVRSPKEAKDWPPFDAQLVAERWPQWAPRQLPFEHLFGAQVIADLKRELARATESGSDKPLPKEPPGDDGEAEWPSAGWSFRDGQYSFRGKIVPLSGKPLALLKTLGSVAAKEGKVSIGDLRSEVWGDQLVDEKTVRVHLTILRDHLRECWRLPQGHNPIPSQGERKDCVYWLDMPATKGD